MWFFKKTSPRRSNVRKRITDERFAYLGRLADTDVLYSIALWIIFVIGCIFILSGKSLWQGEYSRVLSLSVITILVSLGAAIYICHYQSRIIKNHARASALVGLFILLLGITKTAAVLSGKESFATGTTIAASIILTIAYYQRFALGMSIFYAIFACFATIPIAGVELFLTMSAGAVVCCFSLDEIRTRMKLLKVSILVSTTVFVTSSALGLLSNPVSVEIFTVAGSHAVAALIVGLLMQSLLPVIEKTFRIATSMTLIDHSDANNPLLKKLAMESPGTFSHSLLVGAIAEAAAEAIGRNGLLCRVGAYYHDIGKINKPHYFIENEMGSVNRHKELSPAMSQLIIVGHVKDGIEMAREYGLPVVLRQFIETHHGTTLIEYFYNEAKKKQDSKQSAPSETEFRYAGPKPRTKEAAIVMLADTVEGATRSLSEVTPTRIEAVVHNMAMKRLQDGQFDECDLSLRELHLIEKSMVKSLSAHYHGRIAYPTPADEPLEEVKAEN